MRPISIEPESPMKTLVRWTLCGKKPRHMPHSTAVVTSAGVVSLEKLPSTASRYA